MSSTENSVTEYFIIGDVQGSHQILKALLTQEGLLDFEGNRLRPEVLVIQLGDLGHFANYAMGSQRITPADDIYCFNLLRDGVIDFMLHGNHDRPLMGHLRWNQIFGGYNPPHDGLMQDYRQWRKDGKIKIAYAVGDFLLTHAGLVPEWEDSEYRTPQDIADKLNAYDEWLFNKSDREFTDELWFTSRFIDTISPERGGSDAFGGILWRDNNFEGLWDGVRQIYGHTSYETIKSKENKSGISYCLDVSKYDRVGAIWLPDERVVTLGLDDSILNDTVGTDR